MSMIPGVVFDCLVAPHSLLNFIYISLDRGMTNYSFLIFLIFIRFFLSYDLLKFIKFVRLSKTVKYWDFYLGHPV